MLKPKTVLFDLDDTLADTSHRRHFLEEDPSNYDEFNKDVLADVPIQRVIDKLKMFKRQGNVIIILTGRPIKTRKDTLNWLSRNKVPVDELIMKQPNETMQASRKWKEIMTVALRKRYDIVLAIDDKLENRSMFEDLGLKAEAP